MGERKNDPNNIYYATYKGEGENKKLSTPKPLANALKGNIENRKNNKS